MKKQLGKLKLSRETLINLDLDGALRGAVGNEIVSSCSPSWATPA